ncbi:MAG: DUF4270 domain-containing protein [Flavobacteriales bacterium]
MTITSSTQLIRKAAWLSLFVLLLNCKKDENFIGSELQTDNLSVNQLNDFSLRTYTKKSDSLRADEISISTLGSYQDAVTGTTTSSFYTQLRIPVDNVNFSGTGPITNIVLDSVVFSLQYQDHYGSLDAQTFEVYQMNEDLFIDSNYYNGRTFADLGTNLVEAASQTQVPDPVSSVIIDGTELPSQLRLKLNKGFGQAIIDESGNTTLSNNENFTQLVKGLHVKVNNPTQADGEGAILLMDLLSINSKVTLYYRDTAQKDTTSFDLLINASTARVNLNTHDYTGTQIEAQLLDSTLGQSQTFLHGLEGVRTEVSIDDLLKLKDSNIIVNKAVLTMPIDFTGGGSFEPNPQLIIVRNEDGLRYLLPDQTMFSGTVGLEKIGGQWDSDNSQYEFIITRYVNNVLNGTFPNNNLTIETASSMVTPARAILYGHNSVVKQPKLTLTYTKY